jgi:hypothetical protein
VRIATRSPPGGDGFDVVGCGLAVCAGESEVDVVDPEDGPTGAGGTTAGDAGAAGGGDADDTGLVGPHPAANMTAPAANAIVMGLMTLLVVVRPKVLRRPHGRFTVE